MYELFAAVWTAVVLGQNLVGLITQEVAAMGTCIVALKLTTQLLPLLGYLRSVPIGFDKEDQRHDDGKGIKQDIPNTPAASGDAQRNGDHRDKSCQRAEGVELPL